MIPTPTAPDLTMLGLFLQADIVVKSVMVLLVIASLACWAVIIEKMVVLMGLARQVKHLHVASNPGAPAPQDDGLAARVLRAGAREWHEGREADESRAEYRERLERAMRGGLAATLRRTARGLPILATTGAVAPFVGLFGTVWGIMNSFAAIAQSNDTSLAVVAPGIAEALFATAIGLAAAIPAVIGYNRLSLGITRLKEEGIAAIGELAAGMSRRNPSVPAAARAHSRAAE